MARLLTGQGKQALSPCLDLKVPGLQADKKTEQEKSEEELKALTLIAFKAVKEKLGFGIKTRHGIFIAFLPQIDGILQ